MTHEMNKIRIILGVILIVSLVIAESTFVFASDDSYTFSVLINGKDSGDVYPGEIFVLSLSIKCDDIPQFQLFSFQDYIYFDNLVLEYVDDSITVPSLTHGAILARATNLEDSSQKANCLMISRGIDGQSGGDDISGEIIVFSCRMKVINTGNCSISQDKCKIFKNINNKGVISTNSIELTSAHDDVNPIKCCSVSRLDNELYLKIGCASSSTLNCNLLFAQFDEKGKILTSYFEIDKSFVSTDVYNYTIQLAPSTEHVILFILDDSYKPVQKIEAII